MSIRFENDVAKSDSNEKYVEKKVKNASDWCHAAYEKKDGENCATEVCLRFTVALAATKHRSMTRPDKSLIQ